jgi:hypothetical protein
MRTMLTSGAAKLLRVSIDLVRHYANTGRLAIVGRNAQNQRLLDVDEVERIRKARLAWARPRRCLFCSRPIPQHAKFCNGEACTKRRQRLRFQKHASKVAKAGRRVDEP